MKSLRVFFALLLFQLFLGSAGFANQLCPITHSALTNTRGSDTNANPNPIKALGSNDRFFLSMAELNGHLDGIPRLLYATGRSDLQGDAKNCLVWFGQLYARAKRLSRDHNNFAGLRLIGHTDAEGGADVNYRTSLRRALRAREVLGNLDRIVFGEVTAEGRGEANPWFCGDFDKCGIVAGGFGQLGPVLSENERVNIDRRLEIRFEGSSLAGPNLASASLKAWVDEFGLAWDPQLAWLSQRMRHYPTGNAPLAPIILRLGDTISSGTNARNCDAAALPQSAWEGFTFRTGDARDFREANLFARLRLVPISLRPSFAAQPKEYELELHLATGIVSPTAPGEGQAETAVSALASPEGGATLRSESTPAGRYALGLGVPDYWMVRLELRAILQRMLADSSNGLSFLLASEDCSPIPQSDRANWNPIDWIVDQALEDMPRDFDGMLAHAYEYDRRTRMFGLFPGHHLRVTAGGYSASTALIRNRPEKRVNLAQFGISQDLFLYAAPTAIEPSRMNVDFADLVIASGFAGHRSVSLDPALQQTWLDIKASTDLEHMPKIPTDGAQINLGYYLDDPLELERFLRGRVVRVFQPGPRRNDKDGQLISVSGRRLLEATAPDKADSSDLRDTFLLAAPTVAHLDEFARLYALYKPTGSDKYLLASDDSSLCHGLINGSSDADLKALHEAGVRCGFMRHNVKMSLLLNAALGGEERRIPLGTRLGSFLNSRALEPCFAASPNRPSAEFSAFHGDGPPNWRLQITELGEGLSLPDFVDSSDCRLLALPILNGGNITW